MTLPQPSENTENEKIIAALRENITWLKKINDKLAFFVFILIIWVGISVLGFILNF